VRGLAAATVTTTYTYNSDGAPVRAQVSRNGVSGETIFFTYDNFVPDASDPRRGSVRSGTGNLIALGPEPGEAAAQRRMRFDERDRMVACTTGGAAATYGYDARSWLAQTTLESGDQQRLYHGNAPRVTNQRQTSTGTTASFLGPVRYRSDGREQTLLAPRKDTAATYEASAELLQAHALGSYGAPRGANDAGQGLSPDATRYDLSHNPFQYAGEYRDPVCETYDLRARWYLPEHQVFVSRDPADPVHRYGYTGGNPVNRTDPSGLSYRGFQRFVGKAMKSLTPWGVTALSALPWVGPAMFLLQTSAAGAFWHDPSSAAIVGFQALSAGMMVGLEGRFVDRALGYSRAFAARNFAEGVAGVGQAGLSSINGRDHIAPKAFAENIAVTAGSVVLGRAVAGVGYRPFNMSVHDVDAQVATHFAGRAHTDQTVLVYRVKARLRGGKIPFPFTSPLGEALNVGLYHEAVVGVGQHSMHYADMRGFSVNGEMTTVRDSYENTFGRDAPSEHWREDRSSGPQGATAYRYAGTFEMDKVRGAFENAPGQRGFLSLREQGAYAQSHDGKASPNPYRLLTNNCHDFSAAILKQLGH